MDGRDRHGTSLARLLTGQHVGQQVRHLVGIPAEAAR